MKKMYVYPKFSQYDFIAFRLGGAGLGNLLFPWARSLIKAKKFNLPMISPTWPSIKVGPILRSETDTRHYVGNFRAFPDSVGGIKKTYLVAIKKKYSEEMDINNQISQAENLSGVIIFEGLKNYFEDILHEYEYIRKCLVAITKPKYHESLNYSFDNSVTLHVRLGDFLVTNQQTDLTWFKSIIQILRELISPELKFYLFSDGNDEQLAPLLQLGNIERLNFGSSIADMLALSQSKVLIASRGSTFSMWGAYLGRMPFIQPNGGRNYRVYGKEDTEKQIQWAIGDEFPELFLRFLKDRLKKNSKINLN